MSVVLMFGILSGMNILSSPRFDSYPAVDLVHVLGTGMCFGAAIAFCVSALRSRS